MKKASLLFDLDNTLVDRQAAFHAYVECFVARNSPAFAGEDIARVHADIVALDCCGRKDRTDFCHGLLRRFPQLPYTPESLWEDHMALPDFVKPDNAVNAMLGRLATDYQLLIVSNGSAHMQRRKIRQAGLAEFFEHIFISGEVGYAKPDQRLFRHALQHCSHANTIMVGDDYALDIQPAIAMQLKTVYIHTESAPPPVKPDVQLTTILALEEALACLI